MKKTLLIGAILLLLTACAKNLTPEASQKTPDENPASELSPHIWVSIFEGDTLIDRTSVMLQFIDKDSCMLFIIDDEASTPQEAILADYSGHFTYNPTTGFGTVTGTNNSFTIDLATFSSGFMDAVFESNGLFRFDKYQCFYVFDDFWDKFTENSNIIKGYDLISDNTCFGPLSVEDLDTTEDIDLDLEFPYPQVSTQGVQRKSTIAALTLSSFMKSVAKDLGGSAYTCLKNRGINKLMDLVTGKDEAARKSAKNMETILNNTNQMVVKLSAMQEKMNNMEAKLNTIMSQLGNLDKKLDNIALNVNDIARILGHLSSKVDFSKYEDLKNQRNTYVQHMHNANFPYYSKICQMTRNTGESDSAYLTRIRGIVDEWAKINIDGNPSWAVCENYMDFVMNQTAYGKNIYYAYDVYCFYTHVWESNGYVDRKAFRNSDLAVVYEAFILTTLYYQTHYELDGNPKEYEVFMNMLQEKFQKFIAFVESVPVVEHKEAICQLAGCNIVITGMKTFVRSIDLCIGANDDKGIATLLFHFRPEGSSYATKRPCDFFNNDKEYLTKDEAAAILAAYGGKKSLARILYEDAGLHYCDANMLNDPKTMIVTASDYKAVTVNWPGTWKDFRVLAADTALKEISMGIGNIYGGVFHYQQNSKLEYNLYRTVIRRP